MTGYRWTASSHPSTIHSKHYVLSGKILGVSIGGNPCYDLECIVEGWEEAVHL
jgi:hypothetical protein